MIFTNVLGDIYLDGISIDNSRKKLIKINMERILKKKDLINKIHLRSLIILLNLKL